MAEKKPLQQAKDILEVVREIASKEGVKDDKTIYGAAIHGINRKIKYWEDVKGHIEKMKKESTTTATK